MKAKARLRAALPLGAALLIFTALTIVRFNQSLWSDEASSLWFSRYPIGSLISSLCDPHPPGYYLFLKFWTIVGDHETWLRLPSLIAGWVALLATYRLGQERWGSAVAMLAVWLLALQPLQSWYASEVRMYALVQALGVVAIWLGWRLLTKEQPRRREWGAYIVVAAIALWMDYSAALPLLIMHAIWLALGHPRARHWLLAQAAAALPMVLLALTSQSLLALGRNYSSIFMAVQAAKFGIDLSPATASGVLIVVAGGLTLIGLIAAAWWPRLKNTGLRKWAWTIGLLWVGALLFTLWPQLFTLKRQMMLLLPYLALFTAVTARRWSRGIRFALIGITALAAVLSLFTLQREPWRDTVQQLAAAVQPQSAVVWVDEMSVPIFAYYWGNTTPWTTFYDQDLPALPALQTPPNGDLWLVTAESAYRHVNLFLPDEYRAQYRLIDERQATGIGVYHYRRQAPATVTPPSAPSVSDTWGMQLLSPLDTCTP